MTALGGWVVCPRPDGQEVEESVSLTAELALLWPLHGARRAGAQACQAHLAHPGV